MKWTFVLGLTALLSACATVPRPEGGNRAGSCFLPEAPVRAVIVAVHGLNDHRGAFTDLARQLVDAGIALYTYDQRGFGESPLRGGWAGARTLADDLHRLTRALARRHPGVPIYVLGESMGAAVAILAAGSRDPWPVAGLILSAPALFDDQALAPYKRDVLNLLAALFPDITVSAPADITVTGDPEVAERLRDDEWLLPYIRLEVLAGVVNLMEAALQVIPRMDKPVLVLYGARDPVVPPDVVERLVSRLRGPVTTVRYRSGYHLLLRGGYALLSAHHLEMWLDELEAETAAKMVSAPPDPATPGHRGHMAAGVSARPALEGCPPAIGRSAAGTG